MGYIWREKFKAIAKNFYRGAHGVLLVYDICDKKGFLDVKDWIEKIIENTDNDNIVMILCGNKIDKEKERKISIEESIKFSKEKNIPYFEISAKTNEGIKEMFDYVTIQCKQIVNEENFNIFTSAILFKNDFNIEVNNEKKKCC